MSSTTNLSATTDRSSTTTTTTKTAATGTTKRVVAVKGTLAIHEDRADAVIVQQDWVVGAPFVNATWKEWPSYGTQPIPTCKLQPLFGTNDGVHEFNGDEDDNHHHSNGVGAVGGRWPRRRRRSFPNTVEENGMGVVVVTSEANVRQNGPKRPKAWKRRTKMNSEERGNGTTRNTEDIKMTNVYNHSKGSERDEVRKVGPLEKLNELKKHEEQQGQSEPLELFSQNKEADHSSATEDHQETQQDHLSREITAEKGPMGFKSDIAATGMILCSKEPDAPFHTNQWRLLVEHGSNMSVKSGVCARPGGIPPPIWPMVLKQAFDHRFSTTVLTHTMAGTATQDVTAVFYMLRHHGAALLLCRRSIQPPVVLESTNSSATTKIVNADTGEVNSDEHHHITCLVGDVEEASCRKCKQKEWAFEHPSSPPITLPRIPITCSPEKAKTSTQQQGSRHVRRDAGANQKRETSSEFPPATTPMASIDTQHLIKQSPRTNYPTSNPLVTANRDGYDSGLYSMQSFPLALDEEKNVDPEHVNLVFAPDCVPIQTSTDASADEPSLSAGEWDLYEDLAAIEPMQQRHTSVRNQRYQLQLSPIVDRSKVDLPFGPPMPLQLCNSTLYELPDDGDLGSLIDYATTGSSGATVAKTPKLSVATTPTNISEEVSKSPVPTATIAKALNERTEDSVRSANTESTPKRLPPKKRPLNGTRSGCCSTNNSEG